LTPERWQQISRIFKSAISLDGEARDAYVANQCGADDSLRAEVDKLIASHKQADDENFIGGQAAEDAVGLLVEDDEFRTASLNKGQQLGSYLILDNIGAGGMGEVYLARDSRLDRTVALKVLPADIASDKRRMQRFRQEAKVASSLNQPNILTIFEFGEVNGLTFLATEFIDGETLRQHLRAKRIKLSEIINISIQVLAALDAAHEAHIVHRDIKPENVMIRRRDHVVKVLDFGLAKLAEKRTTMQAEESEAATAFKTTPGMVMGTINYMSPEQAQAGMVDERTDIWSTGVMIYEMIAGVVPFEGATTSHTIVQILEKDPAPLSKVAEAPPELDRIVMKAIAKDPDERYQTARDMLIDLRSLQKQLDLRAELDRTSSPNAAVVADRRVPQKRRTLFIVVAGMLLVTAGIFAVNIWRSRERRNALVSQPAAAPVATEERTLTYWITVQKYKDGKPFEPPFPVAGEINFESTYQVRVHVSSPQPGHLYIFNEGPPTESAATEFVVTFPSTTANNNSSVIEAGQVVQIPETSWLVFDKERGVETLWVVFSKDEILQLETARKFATPKTKNLIADVAQNRMVQDFLTANSVTKPSVDKGRSLTTLKAPGSLLVYAIRLEHH